MALCGHIATWYNSATDCCIKYVWLAWHLVAKIWYYSSVSATRTRWEHSVLSLKKCLNVNKENKILSHFSSFTIVWSTSSNWWLVKSYLLTNLRVSSLRSLQVYTRQRSPKLPVSNWQLHQLKMKCCQCVHVQRVIYFNLSKHLDNLSLNEFKATVKPQPAEYPLGGSKRSSHSFFTVTIMKSLWD